MFYLIFLSIKQKTNLAGLYVTGVDKIISWCYIIGMPNMKDYEFNHPEVVEQEHAYVEKFIVIFNAEISDDEYFNHAYKLIEEIKQYFDSLNLDYRDSFAYDYIKNVLATNDPYYLAKSNDEKHV